VGPVYTGAQINFGDLTPYLTHDLEPAVHFIEREYFGKRKHCKTFNNNNLKNLANSIYLLVHLLPLNSKLSKTVFLL
jgi:hypothetical protein